MSTVSNDPAESCNTTTNSTNSSYFRHDNRYKRVLKRMDYICTDQISLIKIKNPKTLFSSHPAHQMEHFLLDSSRISIW